MHLVNASEKSYRAANGRIAKQTKRHTAATTSVRFLGGKRTTFAGPGEKFNDHPCDRRFSPKRPDTTSSGKVRDGGILLAKSKG